MWQWYIEQSRVNGVSASKEWCYLRLLALKAGERPFLMSRHQSFVLEVNRLDFSSSWASYEHARSITLGGTRLGNSKSGHARQPQPRRLARRTIQDRWHWCAHHIKLVVEHINALFELGGPPNDAVDQVGIGHDDHLQSTHYQNISDLIGSQHNLTI